MTAAAAFAQVPADFREDPAKYWNLAELEKAPAARPCEEPESAFPGMEALYLAGRGPEGTAAEFFAYFALPSGPRPAKGWPAVLLVHGGGGTAYPNFVERWRREGFAVLAIDWYNSRPAPGLVGRNAPLNEENLPRRELPGGRRADQRANVANMVLAHSYLRARPEVDPERTVFVGLSWGSWYGGIVAAVDPRFRGAVEIYCGDAVPSRAELVNGRFLHAAKVPMHWFVSTNDANVTPDSLNLGWSECANLDGVTIVNDLPHGHCGFGFPGCIRQAKAFAGFETPFPKLGAPKTDDRGRVFAEVKSAGKGIRRARLCYTRSRNANTRLRPWEECPAEVQLGHVYGRLPPDVVQCYLSVEDEEDAVYGSCRATTPFVTVDDAPPRHVRVAASDSSVTDRRSADFVCTGRNDEETVNRALALLTRGGTVQLLDGNYFFDSFGQEGNSMVCAGYNDGVARTLNLVGTTENKSYNTSFGAVIHVTERAMKAIDPAKGEHRVFFGTARKPEAKPDWFTYTHVNNMNFENFYLKFHDASRPLVGIDCRNFGSTYMRLVGVYSERYFRDRFEHLKPATPAKGTVGIVSNPSSNDEMARIGFDWVNVGGLHTGFRFIGADHLVLRSCSAARCCCGYEFSSMAKTLTLLNCCDEGNTHLPVFRGKGQISLIDFNIERFNAAFIPDDPEGLSEPYATEETPGAWHGTLTYTLQGRAFGLDGFWKAGHGAGFETRRLNQ